MSGEGREVCRTKCPGRIKWISYTLDSAWRGVPGGAQRWGQTSPTFFLNWTCLNLRGRAHPSFGMTFREYVLWSQKSQILKSRCHTKRRMGTATSFFWYDNDKALKACFLVTRVEWVCPYQCSEPAFLAVNVPTLNWYCRLVILLLYRVRQNSKS